MNFAQITKLARKCHRDHDLRSGDLMVSPIKIYDFVVGPKLDSGFVINLYKQDVAVQGTYSVLLRYPSRAEIHIADLSDCWRKLCFVKELCHHLLDSTADFVTDEGQITVTAQESRKIPRALAERGALAANEELNSEQAAYLMALELLIPWESQGEVFRSKLFEQGASIASDEALYPIANIAKVPTAILKLFYSGPYGAFSANQYTGLGF